LHAEIEPIGVTFGVGVHLHQQVVLLAVVDVGRIKVATFEILVEAQDVLLVNEFRQDSFQIFIQIVFYVLGSLLFIMQVPIDQELKIVPALSQVIGSVAIIDLVSEEARVIFASYSLFCLYLYLFSKSLQLFLNGIIFLFFLLFFFFVAGPLRLVVAVARQIVTIVILVIAEAD
jgi:hypothetical protein